MTSFDRYVLRDWPEDRLPVCSASTCGRTIENGQPYAVLAGTIKMVCLSCAYDPYQRETTVREMAETAITKERAARTRRITLEATRYQRDQRQTVKARRVVVKPKKPTKPSRPRTSTFRYPPHPCRFCQQIFQPRAGRLVVDGNIVRGPQPYCSISCSVRGRRQDYMQRVCPACDRAFFPKRGSSGAPQICCSRSCGQWWRRNRSKNPNPPPESWSRSWGVCCRSCGRSDRRHKGQGYCPTCYRRHRLAGQPRKREPRQTDQRTWADRMNRARARAAAEDGGRKDPPHSAISPQLFASAAVISR